MIERTIIGLVFLVCVVVALQLLLVFRLAEINTKIKSNIRQLNFIGDFIFDIKKAVFQKSKNIKQSKTNICYIKAEIVGGLPSGKKRVHILANNADGVEFYTDDESIIKNTLEVAERIIESHKNST